MEELDDFTILEWTRNGKKIRESYHGEMKRSETRRESTDVETESVVEPRWQERLIEYEQGELIKPRNTDSFLVNSFIFINLFICLVYGRRIESINFGFFLVSQVVMCGAVPAMVRSVSLYSACSSENITVMGRTLKTSAKNDDTAPFRKSNICQN